MAAGRRTSFVVPTGEDTRGRRWQVLAAPDDVVTPTRRRPQYRK